MKKLSVTHLLMARSVALEQATPQKLGELTGFSNVHISRIVNDPVFIDEVDRLTNKVEEYEVTRKRQALGVVYENIEGIVKELCSLATTAKSEAVRTNACDKIMSYVYRKKDTDRDDKEGAKYTMIQVNPRESIKNDPDVNPQRVNIIEFNEITDIQ